MVTAEKHIATLYNIVKNITVLKGNFLLPVNTAYFKTKMTSQQVQAYIYSVVHWKKGIDPMR